MILLSTVCYADQVVIDSTGWTQRQKNRVKAAVSAKLHYDHSVSFDSVSVEVNGNLHTVTVTNNSEALTMLDSTTVKAKIEAIEVIDAARNAEAAAKQAELNTELRNTELKQLSLNQIDTKIDSISNLAEAKSFLKKLCRYLVAREVIR